MPDPYAPIFINAQVVELIDSTEFDLGGLIFVNVSFIARLDSGRYVEAEQSYSINDMIRPLELRVGDRVLLTYNDF